jgi:hypothetical protein
VTGFGEPRERQTQAYLDRYAKAWRLYQGGLGSPSEPRPWEAVVRTATLEWAAKQYLPKEWQEIAWSLTSRWSLEDHAHFFRAALVVALEASQTEFDKLRRELFELINADDLALKVFQETTPTFEYLSPDERGMRTGGGIVYWQVAVAAPRWRYWVGTEYVDPREAEAFLKTLSLDEEVRRVISRKATALRQWAERIRSVAAAPAAYKEAPEYPEPPSATTEAERQDVVWRLNQVADSFDAVLAAADAAILIESPMERAARTHQENLVACQFLRDKAKELLSAFKEDRTGRCSNAYVGVRAVSLAKVRPEEREVGGQIYS